MSAETRTPVVPGIALAAAVAAAAGVLGPVLPAVPSAQPAAAVLAVHAEEVQLAGIGRDIYDSVTEFVQYVVESSQFWIDLIPEIGPPLAQQVGINYFDLIQPVVANTVYYISDLIADPASLVQLTVNYASNLFYVGYNWVSQQAQFFGLPGLTPIPQPTPLAAVSAPDAAPARAGAPGIPAAPADRPDASAQRAPAAKAEAGRPDRRTGPDTAKAASRRAEKSAPARIRGETRRAAAGAAGRESAGEGASEGAAAAN